MICDMISRGDLEGYVFGEASPEVLRRVEAHLFGCAECAAEMRLLRGERRLFRARLDEPAPPVPSFESLLARIDAEPASVRAAAAVAEPPSLAGRSREEEWSLGGASAREARSREEEWSLGGASARAGADGAERRRAGRAAAAGSSRRESRVAATFTAFMAAAAAIGWLWLGRSDVSPERLGGGGAEPQGPEIIAEAVCGSGESPEDGDKTDRIPVSEEPTASIDVSFAPRRTDPVARRDDDPTACAPGAHDVCGNGEAQMTYACEDSVEWCAAGRQ